MNENLPPQTVPWHEKFVRLAGGVAGVLMASMMMVTVIDVLGRYLFSLPFPGAFEVTQLLMAAIVFAGLPHVSKRENHITIDLLDPVTPAAVVPLRNAVVNLLCALCFTVIAWRLFVVAQDAVRFQDVTQYLGFPRAPIIFFGAGLCAVTAIIHLGKVFSMLRETPGTSMQGPGL